MNNKLLAAAGLTILSGCSESPQAPVQPASWTATPAEILGSDASFTRVGSVLALPSGRIWIGQPGDNRILVFAPGDSAPELQLGRRGEGPGEFLFLGHLGTLGDTIVAALWEAGEW